MSNIGNKRTFGENLTYYVGRSGKTQKEIADVVGVAASTFNDWCKGKKYARIDKIEILADYFGIKKSDLIEERVDSESRKLNDLMADIIVRMRSDDEFLSVIESLYLLDSEQIASVKKLLDAFLK